MQTDVRDTDLYEEAKAFHTAVRQPGTGQISEGADIHASPDGRSAVFAGTLVERLEGSPQTRICLTDLDTGDTRVLTFGPNSDRFPRFSPDGALIAFLSDRHRADDFQLYLLNPGTGAARSAPRIEGWLEYLQWSPDGTRILIGAAGYGADISGGQGAVTSRQSSDRPAWMPEVETDEESYRWRQLWLYDVGGNTMTRVNHDGQNVWEAAWCGNDSIAAIASPGPGEGLWYSAHLHLLNVHSGERRELYVPKDQLGSPASAPSGRHLAFVEAVCSDRWLVAGVLCLMDARSGRIERIDTGNVDVTFSEWRSEQHVLIAGHRGLETVVGVYDRAAGVFRETWSSSEVTVAGFFAKVAGLPRVGDCVLVGEGFTRAPEIVAIRDGEYEVARSFALADPDVYSALNRIERRTWKARDGLDIQGWLLLPHGSAPHPLVMYVHGGPVFHWRPLWLGRGTPILMLLRRGFAIFFPNPRGSTGRGQSFARAVVGDMGGADTDDCLSGLDDLVRAGIADPARLGVTGASYGGYMSAWLITQDQRFAAAVPVAPVSNHVTEHLISNIPHFVREFLADDYTNLNGKYYSRSPLMHARRVKTPTLSICGALDRCTPPEEARQFHSALLENGVESVLVTYPEEGHGVRKWPAAMDYAARVVGWFVEHMRR
jgi:dipeptidyl aminopeptidase/acylaminoacyl peptidase